VTEYVAKVLCDAAGRSVDGVCSICERQGVDRVCVMWRSFMGEAEAAIAAVRDHGRIERRKSPNERHQFTANRWAA
jgi:hypothetical protein